MIVDFLVKTKGDSCSREDLSQHHLPSALLCADPCGPGGRHPPYSGDHSPLDSSRSCLLPSSERPSPGPRALSLASPDLSSGSCIDAPFAQVVGAGAQGLCLGLYNVPTDPGPASSRSHSRTPLTSSQRCGGHTARAHCVFARGKMLCVSIRTLSLTQGE